MQCRKEKKCSATVLIRTKEDTMISYINIPSNMIVIDEYKLLLKHELETLFEDLFVSTVHHVEVDNRLLVNKLQEKHREYCMR